MERLNRREPARARPATSERLLRQALTFACRRATHLQVLLGGQRLDSELGVRSCSRMEVASARAKHRGFRKHYITSTAVEGMHRRFGLSGFHFFPQGLTSLSQRTTKHRGGGWLVGGQETANRRGAGWLPAPGGPVACAAGGFLARRRRRSAGHLAGGTTATSHDLSRNGRLLGHSAKPLPSIASTPQNAVPLPL